MNTLTPTDLNFVVRRIPKDIRDLLTSNRLFIAGGFIREVIAGNDPKDIDLFGSSKDFLGAVAQNLANGRAVKPHTTDNAITILCPPRLPVQFITRWCFSDPAPLVASFDFTVCQAAIWWDQAGQRWESMASESFYPDLAARRLVYTFPKREEEAGGSMLRARKFLQRGYSIQADSLAGVIARVAMKVRWEQIHSDEIEAAKVISGLLREVDPMLVVDGLEPTDEHQQFA